MGTRRKYRRKTRRLQRQRQRQRRQRGGSDGFQGNENTLVVKTMGGVPTLMKAPMGGDPNGLLSSAEVVEEV
jgi:hypothetical protein